jgi:hypothetical protein
MRRNGSGASHLSSWSSPQRFHFLPPYCSAHWPQPSALHVHAVPLCEIVHPRGQPESNRSRTFLGGNARSYAGGKWKRQTASAAEDAKTALDGASVTVKQRARKLAEQQKQAGAEQIGGVARAVHGAAREIEQKMPQAAGFIHDAATRIEEAATSLRERSVDDLVRSLNNFARTQPATFFAGAVLDAAAAKQQMRRTAAAAGSAFGDTVSSTYDRAAAGAGRAASAMGGSASRIGNNALASGRDFMDFCRDQPLVVGGGRPCCWRCGRTAGEGRTERFAKIAAEFVQLKVDVIITYATRHSN